MTRASIAFGGGMALAAYHGGVVEAATRERIEIAACAGASAGAITCAILAGSREDERVEQLKRFWRHEPASRLPRISSTPGWISAIERRVLGESGQFHLRNPLENLATFKSVYDLAPLKARLLDVVDFDRLNKGSIRVCVVATDVCSGEPVVFDTANGDRISVEHLLASCGFLPEFAPVEIGGRRLADGGLSWNVPFDPLLENAAREAHALFVADLFARDGVAPQTLAAAAERKNDLFFANQTFTRLRAAVRDPQLAALAIYLMSYRNEGPEAGTEKTYDYSSDAVAQRWRAGLKDMAEAVATLRRSDGGGLHVIRRDADRG